MPGTTYVRGKGYLQQAGRAGRDEHHSRPLASESLFPLLTAATATTKMALSARGYDRVRKVARTIADLAGVDALDADHVGEALQFRMTG